MGISMEAVISGDERVEVEQPLLCWANSVEVDEEVRKILKIMLRAYRLTNNCYDKRFEGAKRTDTLTQYLRVVDNYSPSSNNNVEKMIGIVKANILLRRGQVKAGSFDDPTDDYQWACVILEQLYKQREPENADFLEFLIQLNLGKYFRNMGMYMHRSDYYWRAHDEFENILDKLVKSQNDNSSSNLEINHEAQSWRSFIWLEAAMNLSRSELYLYDLKNAKIHLWNIYQKTAYEIIKADSGIKDIFLGYEKVDGKSQLFPPQILAPILENDERDSICKANSKIRQDYAVQALLQLGIAFRKTRDYAIAREFFATIILQDQEKTNINVDALNNYVVCLRKCGFSIKDPTDVEKSFIQKIKNAVSKKYEKSSVIFDWTTEHIKKLYLAILSCIMRGKNTDTAIKEEYCSNSGKIKISRKNRFATMEYIRFLLREMNVSPDKIGNIGKLIDELLEKNPNDRALFLQKGLFLQRAGKIEDSNEIFRKLYYDYPQIARGTIGLKAFYNVGCNLLAEKKYHEAKKYFEIKKDKSSGKNLSDSNSPNSKVVYLNDLPNIDVLSEMDYAWCLMNVGEYQKAKEIYLDILSQYSCNIGRLGLHNEMKIRNNLIECCLQILAGYYQTCDESEIIEIINNNLSAIYQREPLNGTTLRHDGYYKLLLGMHAEAKDQKSKHYCNALKCFEKASVQLYNDVYVHSGWVSAAYEQWKNDETNSEVIGQVKKRLHYISGPYSIRSCAKLAEILYSLYPRLGGDTVYKVLLRCLARIQLSDGEEGYSLFQELKSNELFSILDPVDRGKLLIFLFQIYKNILDIKDLCRYYPDPNNLPVQYRSIKRLKSYLVGGTDKPGRFTLMNIAYMNDYVEGESFNAMLRVIADNDHKDIVDPYINSQKAGNRDDHISSAAKNIYISSLSLKKDEIPMWISYADTGNGCSIRYSEEFINYGYRKDVVTDVACYSDADYPLYKVCYIDPNMLETNDGTLEEINKSIGKILDLLKKLKSNLKDKKEDLEYVIDEFVRSCFNEVRFLIKDSEYASEEEIRMIHYSKEGKLSVEEDKIPRFYIEREGEVLIDEVILGPKIDTFQQNEISIWLYKTGKVKKVKRSNRHYR